MINITAKRKITKFKSNPYKLSYFDIALAFIIGDILGELVYNKINIPLTIIGNRDFLNDITFCSQQLSSTFRITKIVKNIDYIEAITCGYCIKILFEE